MPFLRSAAQTFNKAAALWRRHGAVPLAVGLAVPDVYYSQDKQAAVAANLTSIATTYGVRKSSSFLVGVLAPIAAYGTVRGAFYLNKQKHNTLEGFQENGVAGKSRKSYGFGSGWMGGIPTSLMGQAIDPEIRGFREDVMDVRSARRELYARIHQEEEASLARMGSLSGPDYMAANIERIRGINSRREGLQAINLSRFNIEVEDADTLLLKRGGLAGFFDNEVQIRLAGIDAPETAGHSNDPLAEVRFWQAQPGGEEAAERLRQIIGTGEGFQAIVGPEKTYGRYLGALVGPGGENINVQLAREGMVAALPFGEAEAEVVQRGAVGRAQAQAQAEEAGIWGMARYKAISAAQEAIGQPITYNTMTRLDKLSQNLNLGAYASFLQDMGTERRALTPEEEDLSRRMGYSLKKSHGPQRFNKAKNPIKGHDSGHWGRNWVTEAIDSDFLPGASWVRAAVKAGASLESIVEAGTRMGAGIVKGQLKAGIAASGRGVAEIAQSLKGKSADEILATINQEFRVATKEGASYIRGRTLERGSFKQATLVHGAEPRSRKAVLTEQLPDAGPVPNWEMQVAGIPIEVARPHPAHKGLAERAFLPSETEELLEVGQEILRGGAMRASGKALGTLDVEIATQRAARRALGESVPGVVGTTEKGFIQEYAGSPFAKPRRIRQQIEAITTKYTSTQRGAGAYRFEDILVEKAESFLKQGLSGKEMVAHLDLHRGNILRQGTKLRVIDWGVAGAGVGISRGERELLLRAQRTSSTMRIKNIRQQAERDSAIRKQQAAALAKRAQQAPRDSATPVMNVGSETPIMKIGSETPVVNVQPPPIPKRPPPIPKRPPRTTPPPIPKVRQRNRLQSEASGIGFRMNAARKGSTKM